MAGFDKFRNYPDQVFSQGRQLMLVAPSDANDLPFVPKALVCTVAGNIVVTAVDGNLQADGQTDVGAGITFAVGVGDRFDAVRVKRVWSTNTTATVVAVL